ncbi:MAG: succinic semialdehyde dehydrogenase [Nocardioides sp.]
MTATLPTESTDAAQASTLRPAWVTDARVASWLRWVYTSAGAGTASRAALAPYDALPTIAVPDSTVEDVAAAVDAARHAQAAWSALPYCARAEVILRFHDLLVERQDEIIDLIQWEMGKARFHAWQEVLQVANLARHYARHGEAYLKPKKVRAAVPVVTSAKEVRVPKGVAGFISPWNYPLYMGVGDLIPAVLAGNAAVGKADPQAPLSMLWARALMAEAGMPEHVWGVVAGDGPSLGEALIDHVDYICFTGSTATGRIVAQRAASRLIGASLELGGKNPSIIRADADLDVAARGVVDASFANTGQMCIHLERIIVHTDVYDEFVVRLRAVTAAQTVGQTFDFTSQVGSLASAAQLEKVSRQVADAVAKGATVLAGGGPRPEVGPYVFAPTILEGVTDDMELCLGETFGPVISLYRATDDEDAIAQANRGKQGLSASIFSKDIAAAEAMAPRIRAGSVNINDGASLAAGSIEAGMGGMGESGLGKRHGSDGITRFTNAQTIVSSKVGPVGPPPGTPVEKFIAMANKQLLVLRRLRVR